MNKNDLVLAGMFFDTSSEAFVVTDKQNKIVLVNKAFEKITGYSKEEVVGQKPSVLKSGKHSEDFYKVMWKTLNEHGTWNGEIWDRRKNGQIYLKSTILNMIKDENNEVLYHTAIFTDISSTKKHNQLLDSMLKKDYLTGLDNRLSLSISMEEYIRNDASFAILFLDLDNFKYINDTLGHSVGDKLLIDVANRLKQLLRGHDIIARLGGDEFVILLRNIQSKTDISIVANKILNNLASEFDIYNKKSKGLFVTPSIGISIFPQDGQTVDDLLKHADLAMYEVKNTGKNGFHFFSDKLILNNTEKYDNFSLEHDLRRIVKNIAIDPKVAIECGHIIPYFQPIYDISNEEYEIVGYEVLSRWYHPSKGFVPPNKFIPIAENLDLMNHFFFHIFNQSLAFLKEKRKKLYFNISPTQLSDLNFLDLLLLSLEKVNYNVTEHNIDYNIIDYIGLEFTENALIYQEVKIIDKLIELNNLGLELVIDDFGTGYSSLSYLSKLPIKKLKIDGSFIREINFEDPHNKNNQIIDAIISLCENLEINVVSECVENVEQLDWIKSHGCNLIQGYYLGKPEPHIKDKN